MRAIVIMEPGDTDVLAIKDVPLPDPGPGEVRVCVRAIGINRADLLHRRGMYAVPEGVPRDIPGLEFSGEVEALGPGADALDIGDAVMGIAGGGTYAEYVIVPAAHTIPVPPTWSFEMAAAVPEAFLTAHDALTRLQVAAKEWVIVTAVGSGVGTAAVQLVKARGGNCIGVSRTKRKLERAEALGMDVGLHPTPLRFANEVRSVTDGGANATVDLVGGPFFSEIVSALAPRGRALIVGLMGGRGANTDLGMILEKRLRIEGTILRNRTRTEKARLVDHFTRTVLPLFQEGVIEPVVDRIFHMDEIREAHRHMESNANFGKVVVRVV